MHTQRLCRCRLLSVLLLTFLVNSPLSTAAAGLTSAAPTSAEPSYLYTIRSGDTLWGIAVGHSTSVQRLLALNSQLGDPRLLRPGQIIRVPGLAPAQPPAHDAWPAADPGSEAAPDPQPATPVDATLSPELARWPTTLLALINEKRESQGLPALAWSPELTAAAQAHAEDCAQRNRGSHIGSDGSRLLERLARTGYQASWAGENWVYAQSVQNAFRFWWNEPPGADPHRRNILNPNYTGIGIGVAKDSWGTYVVADFGSR